jgi:AhpD family alkylhydroperoxidase
MKERIDYKSVAPEAYQAMRGIEGYVRNSGLEHSLLELVKTRVSQINGCAHCLEMHTKEALAAGENAQRLFLLSAWREAPCYSGRERAALAWAEGVTRLCNADVDDALFEETRRHFSEKELVDLTLAVIAINGWNRLAVPFRAEVGNYQVRHVAAA